MDNFYTFLFVNKTYLWKTTIKRRDSNTQRLLCIIQVAKDERMVF